MNTSLASKPVTDMSLVEISEHLERITKLIEDERVKERDARLVYDAVANAAEAGGIAPVTAPIVVQSDVILLSGV